MPEDAVCVWQATAHLAVDLATAIKAARSEGTLSDVGVCVLFMRYVNDQTLDEIAGALDLSCDQVRRAHKSALTALARTRKLEGYDERGSSR